MIRAVIFDFDGVIHDTFSIAYKISKHFTPNITIEEYKDYFNGNVYSNVEITPEREIKFRELQAKEFSPLIINEDVKSHLIEIKQNFELFIVSSNWEEHLNMYLKNNSIGHFSEVLGCDTDKSKVKKINMILDKYNLKADECIFITDTLGDLKEANTAGVRSIAVDFGFHNKARLELGKPWKIVSKFNELLSEIKKIE